MIKVESQVHGYRHGHEMLSTSVVLDKTDQAVLDRLSDVAGPLRSGEVFAPYLSIYPLPSGRWNVLARTWPDLEAKRPGCVRTLSLLFPGEVWAHSASLWPYLALLDKDAPPSLAQEYLVTESAALAMPAAPAFSATELLEALFLEDSRPVAVFDAPEPDLIAMRLLTALWPSMRRQFALSTFALSPRRIEGREFDLVFAPRSARQKFAEWPGRRVDGTARTSARHRWTNSIVQRVFSDPTPRLLDESELQSSDDSGNSTAALLRISLLWDELLSKLKDSPTAALGLLDIARTRASISAQASSAVKHALSYAAKQAAVELSPPDAWLLLGAMGRKVIGTPFADEMPLLRSAATALTRRDPSSALSVLGEDNAAGALGGFALAIASGLAMTVDGARAMLTSREVESARVVSLLAQCPELVVRIAQEPSLQMPALMFAGELSSDLQGDLRRILLPYLVENFQLPLASHFISSLSGKALVILVRALIDANDFAATGFLVPIIVQARKQHAMPAVREALLTVRDRAKRSELVRESLASDRDDVGWAVQLPEAIGLDLGSYVVDTLRGMADTDFYQVMTDQSIRDNVLARLPVSANDIARRTLRSVRLGLDEHMRLTMKVLPSSSPDERSDLAFHGLERVLREHFDGDEIKAITVMLGVVAGVFNPAWVVSHGLHASLPGSVISRNLIAFDTVDREVRAKLVSEVDTIASAFEPRWSLDLQVEGAHACANLFWSAGKSGEPALLSAAGKLTRVLLRSKGWPVSVIIPAVFPVVYRELAARDDVPDILKIIPFVDWDKCKPARRELVDAFINSPIWKPVDFALTISLCPHLDRFIARVRRSYRGQEYLDSAISTPNILPADLQSLLDTTLRDIRSQR